MTATEMLARLQRWRGAGWLRPLDVAFAGFVHELDAAAPPSLLLGAALLAHLEGRGHSCLPLADFQRQAQTVLAWPAEAAAELATALGALPADGRAAQAVWSGRSVLEFNGHDGPGSSPMLMVGDRLYLRRYWRYESRLAAQVQARSRLDAAATADLPAPAVAKARALLDRLFAAAPLSTGADAPAPADGPDWQKVACALALRGRFTLVTGGPGTGKTYTAARLLVLLQAMHRGPRPLRVALAAPTGKAAARLRQSIGAALQGLRQQLGAALPLGEGADPLGPARTLHALLGARPGTRRFVHDASNPLDVDLLFVDEASMVHLEMMAALLDALPASARTVLLGDKDQLASVEAGAVMGDLCQGALAGGAGHGFDAATVQWIQALSGEALQAAAVPGHGSLSQQTVTLRQSRRFAGPIGQLAGAVNRGDGAAAAALLQADAEGAVAMIATRDAQAVTELAVAGRRGAPGGYRDYLEALAQRPSDPVAFDDWAKAVIQRFEDFRVLCAVREGPWGVSGLNTAIERALTALGLLPGRGEWYEGRPVMVTRNDVALGVFNGDIGLVLRPPGAGPLRAYFLDGAALRSVSVGRLADVETVFAMTVHKSQGSEFAHVVLVLPEADSAGLTRELVYTGITRAKSALSVVARDAGRLADASGRLTERLSGLRALL